MRKQIQKKVVIEKKKNKLIRKMAIAKTNRVN